MLFYRLIIFIFSFFPMLQIVKKKKKKRVSVFKLFFLG